MSNDEKRPCRASLFSTNKQFCWGGCNLKSLLKSKLGSGEMSYWADRDLKLPPTPPPPSPSPTPCSGPPGQLRAGVGSLLSPGDSGYLTPTPLTSTPLYQSLLSNPRAFTWGRGRRPGESCWSNNLCRDSREGRVRVTSLGAGDKVKVKD